MKIKTNHTLLCTALLPLLLALSPTLQAQLADAEDPTDDSTVVYPADYFAEFLPVSANDMLNRIPGIGLALRGGGRGGGRGLGSGEGEVLINGQRITGKNTSGRNQLSRISADQVDYIEIIRGTSEELDVRGGGQVVNVVLLDSPSRSSTTLEVRTDRLQDGTMDPGAQLSYSGQVGNFNYLMHAQADPRYRASEGREFSYDAAGELIETRRMQSTRDETEYQLSGSVGYDFSRSVAQLNGLIETRGDAPSDTERFIIDLDDDFTRLETEDNNSTRTNWEVGGDFEHSFISGAKYRLLFIVNDREFEFTRNRFQVVDDNPEQNLFLNNFGRDRERIARTSYTMDLDTRQALEFGIEGAQTIRDSELKMGLPLDEGTPSPDFGGLVPVAIDNSRSTVEELRYETFAVHNWQINPRMALESSIIVEDSTIEQSGDVSRSRDFEFIRPKLDYRFDITPTLQLRAGVEKDVSQLSFSDFSATVDGGDEDQNTQAGNPEIKQEQSWRYELNLEYRLPNDVGVVNSQFWYRDVEDHIDRVDVSPSPDDLQSARGNIGDGKRYGLNLDVSTKLGMLNLPNALLTTGVRLRDSEFIDPFLGVERRQNGNGRWSLNMGFRHDMPSFGLTYGLNYSNNSNGSSGRKAIDIFDIEERKEQAFMSAFLEKRAFGNVTFRLESNNITENEFCRTRTRFVGATAAGIVEEIEDYCNGNGMELALKVRTTF